MKPPGRRASQNLGRADCGKKYEKTMRSHFSLPQSNNSYGVTWVSTFRPRFNASPWACSIPTGEMSKPMTDQPGEASHIEFRPGPIATSRARPGLLLYMIRTKNE